MLTLHQLSYIHPNGDLLFEHLHLTVNAQDKVALVGNNGADKFSLLYIVAGERIPSGGTVAVHTRPQQFNDRKMPEHVVKIRLNRFLFTREHWDRPCGVLSGGEKMRLMLCGLTIRQQAPDVIVLDEPTNFNMQNMQILTGAIQDYRGTLIVISHDRYFPHEVKVEREISLDIDGN
jgi:ATPase subunit of ABC transporter with duplicated ATPase domains